MAIGDIWELALGFSDSVSGKDVSTAIHLRELSGGPPSHSELHAEVVQWWNAGYSGIAAAKTQFSSVNALQRTTLRRVQPIDPLIALLTTSLPIAGTGSGSMVGSGSATLLSIRTPLSGRRYRGRQYLLPIDEVTITGGLIDTATALALASGWATMLAAMLTTTNTPAPVVWSKLLGIGTSITQVRGDRRPRSQRRRQVRAGLYQTGVPA